ncbi:MAG: DUF4262 domain-containing protein [Polyangiaceae bacterium]|nr:DUF4262 domain-containing protein [Polyangiaceae bacterium]
MKKQTAVDQIRANAACQGFQILILPPQRPIWAMTYGLMKSVSQPDVVVMGLPPQIMHQMVLNLAGMAMDGETLEHGLRTDRVVHTFECELRTVEPKWHDLLLGPLRELYDDAPPSMLQCTWPDKGGKLPHEEGFDVAFLQRQPRLELADPEVAGLKPLLRALSRP